LVRRPADRRAEMTCFRYRKEAMMRTIRRLAVVVLAVLAPAALTSAAQAAPTWRCEATAVSTSLAGFPSVNPVTSDERPCVSNATGLDNLPAPLGLPLNFLRAQTTSATTLASPAGAIPADQGVGAIGRIENLALGVPGTPLTLGVRVANAQATGVCISGQPLLSGTSEVLGLTLGGQELPLDQIAQQLAAALAPLGQVLDLKVDQQLSTAGSLTVRALHLRVLPATGGAPVLDVIAGEAQVGFDDVVCDRDAQLGGNQRATPGSGRLTVVANGTRGGTCAKLRMYFAANKKSSYVGRYGRRAVVRGRLVNCRGKSIVRARIDVVHVVKGKRQLVKTGLRSRAGGKVTLILPRNLKTRAIRFEYRGNLLSSKVTTRKTLRLAVRSRHGRILR
jgi:hypothetical protein